MSDEQEVCNGCTECAMRCTDGISISEFEYLGIVEALRAENPQYAHRVLGQTKTQPWFEETTYTACLFLDLENRLCLVYPARPLICRLFGRIRHLPCPIERAPLEFYYTQSLSQYLAQPLRTFQAWMAAYGVFNFDDLLGAPAKVPRFEI